MAARNETAERPSAILVYDMIPIRLIAKVYAAPNLPKCLVPVLMSYRTYRSVRYRYYWRYVPAVCLGTYRAEDTIGILTGDIDYQTVIFNINV